MTKEEAIVHGEWQLEVFGGEHAEFIKLSIEALKTLEEFERAQIITGGRLNGRTYAYKCGLEDGRRKALEQESCEDTISRQYVIEEFNKVNGTAESDKLFEIVENAPSIIPIHKKGKWLIDRVNSDDKNKIWNCHCSECKKDLEDYIYGDEYWWLVESNLPNYCPNCGLEMEGVEMVVEE